MIQVLMEEGKFQYFNIFSQRLVLSTCIYVLMIYYDRMMDYRECEEGVCIRYVCDIKRGGEM